MNIDVLKFSLLDSPLGKILAIGNDQALFSLEFITNNNSDKILKNFSNKNNFHLAPGFCDSINSINKELTSYFESKLTIFNTPIHLSGSTFQIICWNSLNKIPFGSTISYKEQAHNINNEKAIRAAANANGANKLAIIIPCHRIIHTNGKIGKYRWGINRKEALLFLERQSSNKKN